MMPAAPRSAGSPSIRRPLAGAALAALLALAPQVARADAVVAKVDGTEIRESDLKLIEAELGPNMQPMAPEQKRDYLITYYADLLILAKAAEAQKLADTADFKKKLTFARQQALMESLLDKVSAEAATDAAMRKVYDETAKNLAQEKEVRARHILVETEDQAKELLKQVKAGGDFAELAKKNSKDPGAAEGGDLGYFSKDQMVPEFAEVAFKTAKGQVSDPVKTQFGWHIVKVEDTRDRQVPPFDQVKPQIEEFVQRRAQADLIMGLRGKAKVERMAAPAAPPPAQAAPPIQPAPTVPAQPKR